MTSLSPSTPLSGTDLPSIRPFREAFAFETDVERLDAPEGVDLLQITLRWDETRVPAPVLVEWYVPIVDIAGKWHPAIASDRSLTAEWTRFLESYATLNAPVITLFSGTGQNRQTLAVSDAIAPLKLQAQVNEEDATVRCRVVLFDYPTPATDHYTFVLRRDSRDIPYQDALAETAAWWAGMEAYRPAPVPPAALEPVYSTWYSFHQELAPETVEDECRWAYALGCRTVIVDDGWQTGDSNKGYDFCGDWEIAPSKFPDFPAHVRRVQEIGLKYMLWYSVPYAGIRSAIWERFRDRVLPKPFDNAACLDPRYPEVRAFLTACYRRAVEEWGVDGLKLDFVDRFTAETLPGSTVEDADVPSVPEAANRLLREVWDELAALRPELLIEFRQRYIGPAMRTVGNLFRAQDCPNDGLSNRVRTVDVRLLAGDSAVHSDMIMWHRDESPAHVALQLWATAFSVPQISVRRAGITEAQERVLAFYLRFWRAHRDTLLHGRFEPHAPHDLYPIVEASRNGERVIACYADRVLTLAPQPGETLFLINATERDRLVVETTSPVRLAEARVTTCEGEERPLDLPPSLDGFTAIAVPSGGVATLTPAGDPA